MTRHSVVLYGHRTSVSVEAPFWDALKSIAEARGVSLNRLIAGIDRDRQGNLSSAIRVYVLAWSQKRVNCPE
ncbi:MAG: ribbon-helix-helix domain-containing protein [Alphaproteobacteria bacterium]